MRIWSRVMPWQRAVTLLGVAITLFLSGCREESESDPRGRGMNIVVIVADALRADHLGCYGESLPVSPNIDRLAAEGALFEQCRTVVPATLPSFITLLTSRHPKDHGAVGNGFPPLKGLSFLSDACQAAGYETAFFASSFCVTSIFGTKQGIDHFDENLDSTAALPFNKTIRVASSVTDAFLNWVEERDDEKPFFAVVHYFDPHIPFIPPEKYARLFLGDGDLPLSVNFKEIIKSKRDLKRRRGEPGERELCYRELYRAEIRYMDEEVGKLVKELDRTEAGEKTITVFTADHGQTLWDHDEYFNHTLQVYESNIRIPLIFRAPGVVPPGRLGEPYVTNIDLAPTLLGFVGASIPEEFAGEDLHRAVLGEGGERKERYLFAEAEKYISSGKKAVRPNFLAAKCIMKGPWKYIWTPHRENREELYNVSLDPEEKNNIVGTPEQASLVKELRKRLRKWALESSRNVKNLDLTEPEIIEKLKSLGYGR